MNRYKSVTTLISIGFTGLLTAIFHSLYTAPITQSTSHPIIHKHDGDKITSGRKIIQDILEKKQPKPTKEYFVHIMHFLDEKAHNNKQSFNKGTFIIEDPDGQLFAWIQAIRYKDKPALYRRDKMLFGKVIVPGSSHMKEYSNKPPYGNYGIDVQDLPWPDLKTVLIIPFIHNADAKRYLFLKPEEAGTASIGEALAHLKDYKKSLERKKEEGADDKPDMRKERVPTDIIKAFSGIIDTALAHKIILTSKAAEEFKKEGTKWGIWKMKKIINTLLITSKESENNTAYKNIENLNTNVFEKICKQHAIADALDIRKGREVIITEKDLK